MGEILVKLPEPISARELVSMDTYEVYDGKMWGNWKFCADNLTLEYQDVGLYGVDLERCTNAAAILDWILQLEGKSWIDEYQLGCLVRALVEVFDGLQGKVCAGALNGCKPDELPMFNPSEFLVRALADRKVPRDSV